MTEQHAGLRNLSRSGGCAAKASRGRVDVQVAAAAGAAEANVIVGLDAGEDGAVIHWDGDRAVVTSVDFFPPLVDDPDDYGAVAAANAVSDIYAMGGQVSFATVISAFPDSLSDETISRVVAAAAAVMADCDGVIVGGHSIRSTEPLFGLSVVGKVARTAIWRTLGARAGDALVLSKALGTGLLLASGKAADEATAVASMRQTNRNAAAALAALPDPPGAVTDVSGYGLLGHAGNFLQADIGVEIRAEALPLLDNALALAVGGVKTSAHASNWERARRYCTAADAMSSPIRSLLCDPQTSGGLLASVRPEFVESLNGAGFQCIGVVTRERPGAVTIVE